MGVLTELEAYTYELENELNVALIILYGIALSLQHFYCELANVYNQSNQWTIDQQKLQIWSEPLNIWKFEISTHSTCRDSKHEKTPTNKMKLIEILVGKL